MTRVIERASNGWEATLEPLQYLMLNRANL